MNSGAAIQDPPGTAPGYVARAWVNFNGTGTVAIRASGNVSSITDNGGTGDYTVNFTTAMSDANYSVISTVTQVNDSNTSAGSLQLKLSGSTPQMFTTSVRFQAGYGSNFSADPVTACVAIFR